MPLHTYRFKHLPQYYKELRSQGIRLVQLLDPFIYDSGGISPGLVSGDRADVWAKTPAGEPAKGTGWFLHQARFPDYTDPVTQVRSQSALVLCLYNCSPDHPPDFSCYFFDSRHIFLLYMKLFG